MVDLVTGYNVPGVYVRDATGPLITAPAVPDAVVTLVGPAVGFQVYTDAVTISATDQALTKHGIYRVANTSLGVYIPKVTTNTGVVLVEGVDYILTDVLDPLNGVANKTTNIKIGTLTTAADGTTTSTPLVSTTNGVKVGDRLIVTYCYTDASYYTPLLFENYDLLVATYGQPLKTVLSNTPGENVVNSPLSLAAAVALQNGATRVICVATDPGDGTFAAQLRSAYAKTSGDYRVSIIVPVLADGGNGDPAAFVSYGLDLATHVENSSADGLLRIGILGPPVNYGATLGTQVPPPVDNAAKSIAAARVLVAYPNRLAYYNPAVNRSVEVDGYYLAAAYAGILEGNPVNQALTRQQVLGFSGLPSTITRLCTKTFKDKLSGSGVAVAEIDRQNRLVVRHGVSTDMSNVITREVSITRARDFLFESLQIGLDSSGLIGSPIDDEMTTRVKGAVAGILETLTQAEAIISYANLQVRQQTLASGGDPSTIEVRFAYRPAIPLNYIVVTFTLNLDTGDVALSGSALP